MLNKVLKMVSADVNANVKQEETKWSVSCILNFFVRSSTFKTWNIYIVKRWYICHLILFVIPSSLILPVKKRVGIVGVYLIDKIC